MTFNEWVEKRLFEKQRNLILQIADYSDKVLKFYKDHDLEKTPAFKSRSKLGSLDWVKLMKSQKIELSTHPLWSYIKCSFKSYRSGNEMTFIKAGQVDSEGKLQGLGIKFFTQDGVV